MENFGTNLICRSQIPLRHIRFYYPNELNSPKPSEIIEEPPEFNKEKKNCIRELPYLLLYSSKIVTFLLKAVREINN